MTSAHNTPTVQPGELLDDSALLSLEDLARTCHMAPDWVSERLEAGRRGGASRERRCRAGPVRSVRG